MGSIEFLSQVTNTAKNVQNSLNVIAAASFSADFGYSNNFAVLVFLNTELTALWKSQSLYIQITKLFVRRSRGERALVFHFV